MPVPNRWADLEKALVGYIGRSLFLLIFLQPLLHRTAKIIAQIEGVRLLLFCCIRTSPLLCKVYENTWIRSQGSVCVPLRCISEELYIACCTGEPPQGWQRQRKPPYGYVWMSQDPPFHSACAQYPLADRAERHTSSVLSCLLPTLGLEASRRSFHQPSLSSYLC